ncbi:RHS repeat-associated protein [Aeromicrobium sp. SORGH_AS981]|uniref:polymorphic toxin-type HINT domain-containing protein n=1 Tax=Aeromicrobium sp. SORGH_AS_0981 TaxID=3041802 RepID=UPI0028563E7F|nr:polymorphic toxin-type HINT domain-containing protein [Aeromicrobium sp. SORGH_AS_0981]MDR6117582.1 RHS repeat-associated protein [Aeromicrobium sp. SORGH_AS_0981]
MTRSTGSYQLGTRTYDPSDAAFTTPDTYRVAAPPTDLSVTTDPLTANTYTYVNGNPVNMMDPDGHRVTCTEGPSPCSVTENGKTRETGKTVRPDGSIYTAAELQRRGEAELAASMSRREALAKKAAAEFDWKGALVDLGVEASGLGDIKRCVMDRDVGACAWAVAGTAGAAIFKAGKTIKKVKNLIDNVRSFNAAKRAASAALSKLDGQISKQAAELKSLAAKVKRSPSSGAGGARKASAKTEAPRRGGGGSSKSSGPREHACSLNSFAGRTLVLMGDKSKKPIEKVRVGEKVWATDPKTGEKGRRTVTHVWKHRDALVDLKVDGETITTTEDHPFWSESEGRFKDAEELWIGESLLRSDGHAVRAVGLDDPTWSGGTAYNLTVEELHTYHVGQASVLVHNCGTARTGGGASLENISVGESKRIQNAADRIGLPISVVGSRASGTANAISDWDYVITGVRSRTKHSVSSSLPRGPEELGFGRRLDIFDAELDETLPHITFNPRRR